MDGRSNDTPGTQVVLSLTETVTPSGTRSKPIAAVEIGELRVSANPHEVLACYSIGAGVCVAIHDPQARLAGLLHFLLPDSDVDPERCAAQPAVFGDTGMAGLLQMLVENPSTAHRLCAYLIGGADVRGEQAELGVIGLGGRNLARARGELARAGLAVTAEHCGGTAFRTVLLDVESGEVVVRVPLQEDVQL